MYLSFLIINFSNNIDLSLSETFTTDLFSISTEFHNNIKVEWNCASDYREKGPLWIQSISDRYNNEKITLYASQILYTETFHFLKVAGVLIIESDEVLDFALIMKGGGIKGLAYVGALEELIKYYKFDWYAGTSAGAITALLLACGYTVKELNSILDEKDFNDFKDANLFRAFYNLFTKKGLYEADSFLEWMEGLLAKKLEFSFGVKLKHLPSRVSIYASRRDMAALIFDSIEEKSKDINAAYTARCSMSIPYFFTPQKSEGLNVFDGGIKNNFPVEVLLKHNPGSKFLGLYLGKEIYSRKKNSTFWDLIEIGTESEDPEVLEKYRDQIVIIDPYPISTFKFKLNKTEKDFLLENGRLAALKFLHKNSLLNKEDFDFENRKIKVEYVRKKLTSIKKKKLKIKFLLFLVIISLFFYFF